MNITKNVPLRCMRTHLFALLAVLLVASCGGGGAGTSAAPSGLSLVAGRIDTLNGTGVGARLTSPNGMAIDSIGNTYVTEPGLNIVRKITPDGTVTLLAGMVGIAGSTDGPAAQALFSDPNGIAVDGSGNVFVADRGNGSIREISNGGVVSTVAGNLGYVTSVAVDSAGNIYAATLTAVLKISQGTVTTLALAPAFVGPLHLAVDTSSNLYIGDSDTSGWGAKGNAVIYRLAPNGTLSTLISFAQQSAVPTTAFSLNGLATDPAGNVYTSNGIYSYSLAPSAHFVAAANTVVKISPSGLPTTVAGVWGQTGNLDEAATQALFNNPKGLAVDPQGNIVVADSENHTIRRISTSGRVTTLVGHTPLTASVDGTGSAAGFVAITGLAADKFGHIAAVEASTVRSITEAGAVSSMPAFSISKESSFNYSYSGAAFDAAGNLYTAGNWGSASFVNSTILKIALNGSSTLDVSGQYFQSLASDALGNIFAANYFNDTLWKFSTDGTKSLFAPAVKYVSALSMGISGDLYACTFDNTVIKIAPSGTVSLLAGVPGKEGYADGPASTALFRRPLGIAIDGSGNVYVADTGNSLIRKITPNGVVSTVAGSFGSGDSVMGALPGGLYRPSHLAFDGDGSLLVSVNSVAVVRLRLP